MIDLDAIRARNAIDPRICPDRTDLLRYVDALRAAAGKVMQLHHKADCLCTHCADLRALLAALGEPK